MNFAGIDFGATDLNAALKVIEAEKEKRRYEWKTQARPKQLAPKGNWRFWLLMAGRGFGKTRTGAEFVRQLAEGGKHPRIALIGPTAADVRDVMVEGDSGILACSPPWFMPKYEPSKRQLEWPNGVIAKTYSADEPERLRGPQHHAGWIDEPAAFQYPEAFTQFKLGFRLGSDLRCVLTTTPKPCPLVRELVKQAKESPDRVVITRGSTSENEANLAPEFFTEVIAQYAGTRLGRQELDGELLEDTPGALWNTAMLERTRHRASEALPPMSRVVVAIDPSVTSNAGSDECGIAVVGKGVDGDGYMLEDLSGVMSPNEWASVAIAAYHRHAADVIVGETNNGGDLVGNTILALDPGVPFRKVTASRGKHLRAEPISLLSEQNRFHLHGSFPKLEEQMCAMASDGYTGSGSPDRLDAMVWGASELMLGGATVQMFPEFRPSQRPGEPGNALHVYRWTEMKEWWPRWISVNIGSTSAALWWCRDNNGRIFVYRELVLQDVTPEAFGMEIAKLSQSESDAVRSIPVWLSDKAFDRVQGKSVASLITDGISRVIGQHKAFLFVHTQEEREIHDPGERLERIESRLRKMPQGFLNVRALNGGKDQTGWDVVRELLRWRGSTPGKREAPDVEWAKHLALTDKRAYQEYVDSFSGNPVEDLPVLRISAECKALIQSMSGAARSASDESALANGNGVFALQSLRIGALASRQEQVAEPREEFVGRRLDAMPDNATTMARMIVAERAETHWNNTQEATPLSFRRI